MNSEVGFSAIAALVCSFILFGGAAIYAFSGRPQIPPTHETFVRIFSIVVALVGLSGVCLCAGLLLIKYGVAFRFSAFDFAFIILLLLPAMIWGVAQFVLYPLQLWRLRCECSIDGKQTPGGAVILEIAETLRAQMRVPSSVQVVFARQCNQSPLAMGTSARNAVIVLPKNLYDLTSAACDEDEEATREMLRLILAHEMAHILNKDLWILPLLSILRSPFRFRSESEHWRRLALLCSPLLSCFLAIVIFHLIASWFHLGNAVSFVVSPLTPLLFFGSLLLTWVLHSTVNERERLADATALLYVSPASLERLAMTPTSESAIPICPLERFTMVMSLNALFSHSFFGFQIGIRSVFAERSINRQRERSNRSELFLTKGAALPRDFLPSFQAVVIVGLLGALLASIFATTIFYAFLSHLVSTGTSPDLNTGVLNAISTWSTEEKSNTIWQVYRTATPTIIGGMLAGLFLLPLRDSSMAFQQINKRDALLLSLYLVIVSCIVSVGFGFVYPHPSFPSFPTLRVESNSINRWLIIASLIFSAFLVFRPLASERMLGGPRERAGAATKKTFCLARLQLSSLELMVGTILIFGWFTIFAEATWLFAGELLPASRLLWILNTLCLVGLLNQWGAFTWLTRVDNNPDEAIQRRRFLWSQRFLTRSATPKSLGRKIDFDFLLLHTFLRCFVPSVVLLLLFYPNLIKMDLSFRRDVTSWERDLTQSMDTALHRGDKAEMFGASSQLYLFHQLGRERFPPSASQGLMLLGIVEVALIMSMAVIGMSGGVRREKPLRQGMLLADVIFTQNRQSWHPLLEPYIARALFGISYRKPFIIGKGGVPMMKQTCFVVEQAVNNEFDAWLPPSKKRKILEWISQCEQSTGGFAPYPEGQADLLHTASGLRLFRSLGLHLKYPMAAHGYWLRCVLAKCLRDGKSLRDSDWLENIKLCLCALSDLNENEILPVRLRKVIAKNTVARWGCSAKTASETRALLVVLVLIKESSHPVWQEIRQHWFLEHETQLARLKPDSALSKIADLIWISRVIYPTTFDRRSSVQHAMDNLEKTLKPLTMLDALLLGRFQEILKSLFGEKNRRE
ncbi:MAG: hypothetical protein ACXWJX_02340 [Limisphaerales bacterium]